MRVRSTVSSLVAIAIVCSTAGAQQRPAIRQLGPVVGKTTETFSSIAGVRPLSGGGVIVNDVSGRKLVLFDAGLGTQVLVADSTSATATAYAGRTGGLIPYRADSSIFVDPTSMSMLIVDGSGKIARVMSVPRTQDVAMLAGPFSTSVGFDPIGRLIYRGSPFGAFGGGQRQVTRTDGGGPAGFTPPTFPDSLPIIRVDLATRKVDTLAFGRIPKVKLDVQQGEGRFSVTTIVNPLPTVDDFAVLPDGTLAMVRGSDYHVDYYAPNGTKTSAPKIAFDWQRLTDNDKVAFIDSVKAMRAKVDSANANRPGGAAPGTAPVGGGGGGPNITIISGGPDGGPRGGGGGGGFGGALGGRGGPRVTFVSPSDLPDYKPAFFAGSTKVDARGNLWIRTIPTKKIEGGPVYDVIDRKGALVDRVQVPAKTSIAGFGADGSVFLTLQNGAAFTLAKAKLR
ncbi:MAG: hypothetical protein H0W63_05220 [Gemmatimonadaceae bacterium]|nr:hypothetical protein [Gemmatimonadaceae bacterium]